MSRPGPAAPGARPHLPPPPDDDDDYREPQRPTRHPNAIRWNGIDWLAESHAYEFASKTTLWNYRRRGAVKAVKLSRDGGPARWHYTVGSLRLARADAARRKAEQRHVAGPGRSKAHTPESLAAAQARADARAPVNRASRSAR